MHLFPKPNAASTPKKPARTGKKPLITYPYSGVRTSYFVYHPMYHGASSDASVWVGTLQRFYDMVNSFMEVAELYVDHQSRSEVVGGKKWKKDIDKLVQAIETSDRDPYHLEVLALCLFDVDDRTSQRQMPYHSELRDAASDFRAMDLGMKSEEKLTAQHVIRHSWSG